MSTTPIGLEYGTRQKTPIIKFFDILKNTILKSINLVLDIVKTMIKQKIGLQFKSTEN